MKGIYIVSDFFGHIPADSLQANVAGASLNFKWYDLQDITGKLDMNYINQRFLPFCNAAINSGKRIKLSILTGVHNSSYLSKTMLPLHFYEYRGLSGKPFEVWMYSPLHPDYLPKWLGFLDLFFGWLKTTTVWQHIDGITVTYYARDTEETRLPCQVPTPTRPLATNADNIWAAEGYTTGKILEMATEVNAKFDSLGKPILMALVNSKTFPLQNYPTENMNVLLKNKITMLGGYIYSTVLTDTSGTPKIVTENYNFGFQVSHNKFFNSTPEPAIFEKALLNGYTKGAKFIEVYPTNAVKYRSICEDVNKKMV